MMDMAEASAGCGLCMEYTACRDSFAKMRIDKFCGDITMGNIEKISPAVAKIT